MSTPITDIAAWIDGEIVGDATLSINAARPISEQPGADDLTVIMGDKYLAAWQASPVRVAIVPRSCEAPGKTLIRVADPLTAFVTVIQKLYVKPVRPMQGIHPTAIVDPTAFVAPDVVLGPHVVVGEGATIGPRCVLHHGVSVGPHCVLGEDVTLHPHVVLYHGTILHNRIELHANVVVGADGFGYRTQGGKHVKSPQVGFVEIEDDVEVGACSTIDRAAFGRTLIGAGTKIDNLTQIAHNCKLGKHNLICAQVGIAGSVTTGDYVVFAGQAGTADHVTIGDRVQVGAQSGVPSDIPADQRMLGTPARPATATARVWASFDHLPELRRQVRRILRHLGLQDE